MKFIPEGDFILFFEIIAYDEQKAKIAKILSCGIRAKLYKVIIQQKILTFFQTYVLPMILRFDLNFRLLNLFTYFWFYVDD